MFEYNNSQFININHPILILGVNSRNHSNPNPNPNNQHLQKTHQLQDMDCNTQTHDQQTKQFNSCPDTS